MELSQLLALVDTIVTVALAGYAGVQIWLIRRDLQESKLSRSANMVLYVIETMNKLRDKRHRLYGLPKDHNTWNEEQEKLADHVGVKLQQVAYLAEIGLIDEKYLRENYEGVFDKSWQKLENYIKDYREATGEPSQRIHLERFAKKCRDHRKKESNFD